MYRYTIADSSLFNPYGEKEKNPRGLNIWTLTELRRIKGQSKSGEFIDGSIQYPLFTLDPCERELIMQSTCYIQAVVTSRMNRISSLDWTVIKDSEIIDETIDQLKDLKAIFDEHDNPQDLNHIVLRNKIYLTVRQKLFTVKRDMSNFSSCLLRYKKRIKRESGKSAQRIIDWLAEPNMEDDFEDFMKKYIESLMVHGSVAMYKELIDNRIDNIYILPGGSVLPLRGETVGSYVGYAQIIENHIPKIYFQNEIAFVNYVPSASRSYGYVPLDALINKITEQLLFDQFAAERADGTKEPEKLIAFGDNKSLFGDLTGDINLPMDKAEQKRIEEKVNTLRKGAIVTLSGAGTPVVVDISKSDTFSAQSNRQDKLLRDIALLFNMTNMEVNLAGGQFTSGKETSETQQEIEEGKGTRPIIKKIERLFNRQILPYRYGTGFTFQFQKGRTEEQQAQLDTLRWNSGTWTKNHIIEDRGDDPVPGEENDKLPESGQAQTMPDGTQVNPFNMRNV